jgi:hypothetical protein
VKSRAWLAICAFAVAAPGVLRDVSVVYWKQGKLTTSRLDDRFSGIAERMPAAERAGFITDAAGEASGRRYFDALYALAPRPILQGQGPRRVVIDLEDPAHLDAILAAGNLRLIAQGAPGVALAERN